MTTDASVNTKNYRDELHELMDTVVREGASDLHLSVGVKPTIRVTGSLVPLIKKDRLSKEDAMHLVEELLSKEQFEKFLTDKELDFSYAFGESSRFRGNCSFQQGTPAVALRLIPRQIRTVQELNLPPVLESFATREQGFFLVVGPVGQGKSTTLAAIIDLVNTTRAERIVTIEDPIEYLFENKQSVINQREVRLDTKDFHSALNSVFRQDVDIIMVGEMREPETIGTAVTAAETGHLVLSTLHTNNAAQTIDRIIDSFPGEQQDQIRIQLAESLAGIFSQRLVPRISGGLIPAYELLINNKAVANLIREGRTHEINAVIETGAEDGMMSLDRSLSDLVRRGEITFENAFRFSLNPKVLERLI